MTIIQQLDDLRKMEGFRNIQGIRGNRIPYIRLIKKMYHFILLIQTNILNN